MRQLMPVVLPCGMRSKASLPSPGQAEQEVALGSSWLREAPVRTGETGNIRDLAAHILIARGFHPRTRAEVPHNGLLNTHQSSKAHFHVVPGSNPERRASKKKFGAFGYNFAVKHGRRAVVDAAYRFPPRPVCALVALAGQK